LSIFGTSIKLIIIFEAVPDVSIPIVEANYFNLSKGIELNLRFLTSLLENIGITHFF